MPHLNEWIFIYSIIKILPYTFYTHEFRYIVNADGDCVEIASDYDGILQGELLIKTPSLFQEYWGKPDATNDTYHKGEYSTYVWGGG